MNAHEACLRARQAWERTQPQYVIPGVLEEVDAGGADGDSAAASASSSAPVVAAPASPGGHPGALKSSEAHHQRQIPRSGALVPSTKEQPVEPAEVDRMVEQLKELCDPRGHDLIDAIGELAREASGTVNRAQAMRFTPPSARPRLLTVTEAADYFGCSRRTIERIIARGDLVPVHVASRRRFRLTDLDKYLRGRDGVRLLDGEPHYSADWLST